MTAFVSIKMKTVRYVRRSRFCQLVLLGVLAVLIVVLLNTLASTRFARSLVFDEADENIHQPSYDFVSYAGFAQALKFTADDDKTVVMALVDTGFLQTAYNFFQSVIIKYDISNFLFVSLDQSACNSLQSTFPDKEVRCFVYKEAETAVHASLYETREFKEKIYLRRFLVLHALRLGYNVLLTDLDLVVLQNPIKDVVQTCDKKKCDMAAMWDDHIEKYNVGFLYVRANDKSIKFYTRLARFEMSHGVGQMAFNTALRELKDAKMFPTVVALNHQKYKVGISVFPRNTCPARQAYSGIYVIHNNYIIEQSNKIYRLKECMLWDWDGRDGYYTNPSRQYISVNYARSTGPAEHQVLLNAFTIGKLLGRTVILPRFECSQPAKCNLLQRIYDHSHLHFVKRFSNATDGKFRESSFLHNPRVPDSIKTSISPHYHIVFGEEAPHKKDDRVIRLVPKDLDGGPTPQELAAWFGHNNDKVLHFDNLVGHYTNLPYAGIVGDTLIKIIRQL